MKNDSLPPSAAKVKHAQKVTHRAAGGKFKQPPGQMGTEVPLPQQPGMTQSAEIPKTVRKSPTRKEK